MTRSRTSSGGGWADKARPGEPAAGSGPEMTDARIRRPTGPAPGAGASAESESRRRRRRARARRLLAGAAGIAAVLLLGPPTAPALAAATVAVAVVLWPSSAGRWAAGAAGEQATARALAGVEGDGWTVFHDVRPPGKRWNLDHVLVGPAGVVVVETKQWRRPVRTFRRHPRLLAERVDWQVEAVARLLGTGAVRGYLCVHGARVRRLRRWTPVGDGRHLRRWLRRLPPVLGRGDVAAVVSVARRTFG